MAQPCVDGVFLQYDGSWENGHGIDSESGARVENIAVAVLRKIHEAGEYREVDSCGFSSGKHEA